MCYKTCHPEVRPGEVFLCNVFFLGEPDENHDEQFFPFPTRRGKYAYDERGSLIRDEDRVAYPLFAKVEDIARNEEDLKIFLSEVLQQIVTTFQSDLK